MRSRLLLLVPVLALLVAACGDGGAGQIGEEATAPIQTEATEDGTATGMATETEAADGETTVAVASSDLGDILVDGDGMTLYLFLPDEQGEPTCTDDCADNWPPLQGPATGGEGVEADLLGTVEHPSGTTQVAYNDWPLYHFAPDEQPGDTNGQGVGDNWYVVSPEGEPIRDGGDAMGGY